MKRIKKGDKVFVISGKDKKKIGIVLSVKPNDKIVVEGVNMISKHEKPDANANKQGGIIKREAPIHVSNVMHVNPVTNKPDRIGFKTIKDGEVERKVRYCKSNDEIIDKV